MPCKIACTPHFFCTHHIHRVGGSVPADAAAGHVTAAAHTGWLALLPTAQSPFELSGKHCAHSHHMLQQGVI